MNEIRVRVLAWGSAADALGWSERELRVPAGTSVAGLRATLQAASRRLAEAGARVRIAVNQQYADDATLLHEGDEAALIPPVSGGSRANVRLQREPIDAAAVARGVEHPECGAVALFAGTVRAERSAAGAALRALEYSAYDEMAVAQMQKICDEARARYNLHGVAVVHRLGELGIGEISILVAVSAAHRGPAFDGCRQIMEAIKADVPIFKKELWQGGQASWVQGI